MAGLPGRGGVPPDEVAEPGGRLRDEDLDVAGLMAVGPPGPRRAPDRDSGRCRLADALDLPVRSMGMTDDLEVALSEGSTMVRARAGPSSASARPAADRDLTTGPARARGRVHPRGSGATHYAVAGRNIWQLRS